MHSHNDNQHTYGYALKQLEEKAREMTEKGENIIAAGAPGETTWEQILKNVGGEPMLVRRLPEDPQAIRVSIGEGIQVPGAAYLSFRGDPVKVADLLKRALAALQKAGCIP